MNKISVSLIASAGFLFATGSAFAYDPAFEVGGRPEAQLTVPCVPHSIGCRADGYPDARYYRPELEGQGNVVYNYNDPRYDASQRMYPGVGGQREFLEPDGHIVRTR